MPSFAEYLPIYIDDALIRAGQTEAKVGASNFMRSYCFQAIHRDVYERTSNELKALWKLVNDLKAQGRLGAETLNAIEELNQLRIRRFELLWTDGDP